MDEDDDLQEHLEPKAADAIAASRTKARAKKVSLASTKDVLPSLASPSTPPTTPGTKNGVAEKQMPAVNPETNNTEPVTTPSIHTLPRRRLLLKKKIKKEPIDTDTGQGAVPDTEDEIARVKV